MNSSNPFPCLFISTPESVHKRLASMDAFSNGIPPERFGDALNIVPTESSTGLPVSQPRKSQTCKGGGGKVELSVVGPMVGLLVGADVGDPVGELVGDVDGKTVGEDVGEAEGDAVGEVVGKGVGLLVGEAVGVAVGESEGLAVGDAVGVTVGESVGVFVGFAVGEEVGGPHIRRLVWLTKTILFSQPVVVPSQLLGQVAVAIPVARDTILSLVRAGRLTTPAVLQQILSTDSSLRKQLWLQGFISDRVALSAGGELNRVHFFTAPDS
mmetsp:Transcript_5415/g.7642  ORF Transcript_5415/g.7642 Transcript_5415/m.7642 type:complete len:268 (-) Transcript_5415:299-1102(-)